jgi:hypothetical protein
LVATSQSRKANNTFSFEPQTTPQIKMAPKNNKGKAKEPEKAGAAKVKGGSCRGNTSIQHIDLLPSHSPEYQCPPHFM